MKGSLSVQKLAGYGGALVCLGPPELEYEVNWRKYSPMKQSYPRATFRAFPKAPPTLLKGILASYGGLTRGGVSTDELAPALPQEQLYSGPTTPEHIESLPPEAYIPELWPKFTVVPPIPRPPLKYVPEFAPVAPQPVEEVEAPTPEDFQQFFEDPMPSYIDYCRQRGVNGMSGLGALGAVVGSLTLTITDADGNPVDTLVDFGFPGLQTSEGNEVQVPGGGFSIPLEPAMLGDTVIRIYPPEGYTPPEPIRITLNAGPQELNVVLGKSMPEWVPVAAIGGVLAAIGLGAFVF